jgi:opacity protein-like surface antigen
MAARKSTPLGLCWVYFLLIAGVGLSGCMVLPVPGGEQAAVFQVFEPKSRVEDTGIGLSGYWFRDQQLGVFLQLQSAFSGAVSGVEYPSLPVSSAGDPVTAREQHGLTIAVGPTWKFNEHLAVYGGLGVGSVSRWEERFDGDLLLSPTGYYHHDAGTSSDLHLTFGSLIRIGDGWVIDAGYGTFSESVHVGLGYSY